jgi:TonB family protein
MDGASGEPWSQPSSASASESGRAELRGALGGTQEADTAADVAVPSALSGSGQGRGGGDAGGAVDAAGGSGGGRAGQDLALALPGAGGSEAVAEYGAYLAALRERIQAALRYPASARRRGLSGTVHVELTIRADGAIETVALLHSSAHAVLDEAALQAVRALDRHPFPSHLPARPLRVRLPVVFALQ